MAAPARLALLASLCCAWCAGAAWGVRSSDDWLRTLCSALPTHRRCKAGAGGGKAAATNELVSDDGVTVKIKRHFQCGWSKDRQWPKKMEFPTGAPLEKVAGRPGCYRLGGRAWLGAELEADDLQMHMQVLYRDEAAGNGRAQYLPMKCSEPKLTGCGGFGSCLYCDLCDTLEEGARRRTDRKMWLTAGNRQPLRCGSRLRGASDDGDSAEEIHLHFCLPTKKQFLDSYGITSDLWKDLVESVGMRNSMDVWLSIYVFDSDVSPLMRMQHFRSGAYTGSQRRRTGEELASYPLNKMLAANERFVGCHKVEAQISLEG